MPEQEWYSKGLSFSCTQCGNCCSGPPGYVWFNYDEAVAMAEFLKLDISDFLRRHARLLEGKWTLNEHPNPGPNGKGYDCTFLRRDEKTGKAQCGIYPVRPQQCRTWPFWPNLLESPARWNRAKQTCPGMDQGKLYTLDEIRIIRDSNHEE